MSFSAHVAAIFLPVAVEPVNAILSTSLRVSAAPVSGPPVATKKTSAPGATLLNDSPSQCPTPGVYSLGLKTTALPAARA